MLQYNLPNNFIFASGDVRSKDSPSDYYVRKIK